jgi:hypothetical protein
MVNITGIVQQLRTQRDIAARDVERLDAALAALNGGAQRTAAKIGAKVSAASRAKMAAAQRARWAKLRGNGGQKPKVVSMPKQRTMSAAARRKIAQTQKARWAKLKSVQKKSA